jgi:hypothetical protein
MQISVTGGCLRPRFILVHYKYCMNNVNKFCGTEMALLDPRESVSIYCVFLNLLAPLAEFQAGVNQGWTEWYENTDQVGLFSRCPPNLNNSDALFYCRKIQQSDLSRNIVVEDCKLMILITVTGWSEPIWVIRALVQLRKRSSSQSRVNAKRWKKPTHSQEKH